MRAAAAMFPLGLSEDQPDRFIKETIAKEKEILVQTKENIKKKISQRKKKKRRR